MHGRTDKTRCGLPSSIVKIVSSLESRPYRRHHGRHNSGVESARRWSLCSATSLRVGPTPTRSAACRQTAAIVERDGMWGLERTRNIVDCCVSWSGNAGGQSLEQTGFSWSRIIADSLAELRFWDCVFSIYACKKELSYLLSPCTWLLRLMFKKVVDLAEHLVCPADHLARICGGWL